MIKVLLIAKTFEAKGGAGRHAFEITKELKNSGIDVCVLTEKNQKVFEKQKNILYPLLSFKVIKFIINILRVRKEARDFDIVHAMEFWPYGVYGYFAVCGTKKKLFMNGVGTYTIAPFKRYFQRYFVKKACLRASRIFSISEYTTKKILQNISLDNISTIFYGTFKLPVLATDEISELKKKYGFTEEYPILLTVGDIKNRKGQLETLTAVNLLKKDYPDIKYIMVGSDDDVRYLQKIKEFSLQTNLSENYQIISNMYDDKILSFFYQICDIFLLNSNNDGEHFEGFGGVLLEAAQFGKPVIGSRDCGIESALRDGYNGYLAEQKKPEDIKEKILMVLKNKEQLSKNSCVFFRNFSWDRTVSEYIKYYKQAV